MDELLEKERILRTERNEPEMEALMKNIIQRCHDDTETIAYLKILSKRKGQLIEPLRKTIHHVFSQKYNQIKELLPNNNNKFVRKQQSLESHELKTPEYLFFDDNSESKLSDLRSENDKKIESFLSFSKNLLKEIIEGKLILEKERVYVTKTLKNVFEKVSLYKEAMDIVFDVPIESFNAIDELNKAQFQLETMRLCFINKEWHRCDIVFKRMRKHYFESIEGIKERINLLVLNVGISLGQKKFLDVSEHLKKLIEVDTRDRFHRMVLCSFFAIISESSKKRNELLRFCLHSPLNNHKIRTRVRQFQSKEILTREVTSDFGNDACVKNCEGDLLKAIDFHNLFVVSQFFESIKIDDLVGILQIPSNECVKLVSKAVNTKFLKCKINQIENVVEFEHAEELSESERIGQVLEQITKIGFMIDDEYVKV